MNVIKFRLESGSVYEKAFLEWYGRNAKAANQMTTDLLNVINKAGMSNAETYGCLEFLKIMFDFQVQTKDLQ